MNAELQKFLEDQAQKLQAKLTQQAAYKAQQQARWDAEQQKVFEAAKALLPSALESVISFEPDPKFHGCPLVIRLPEHDYFRVSEWDGRLAFLFNDGSRASVDIDLCDALDYAKRLYKPETVAEPEPEKQQQPEEPTEPEVEIDYLALAKSGVIVNQAIAAAIAESLRSIQRHFDGN